MQWFGAKFALHGMQWFGAKSGIAFGIAFGAKFALHGMQWFGGRGAAVGGMGRGKFGIAVGAAISAEFGAGLVPRRRAA